MIGREVGIAYGHLYVVMVQDFLERKDVPAGHHEVCCKRMEQDVGKLSARKHDRGFIHHR